MTTRGHACTALIFARFWSLLIPANKALAQDRADEPNEPRLTLPQLVEKLTEKNAEREKALERYTSRRTYQLDYTGFPSSMHAQMVVDMTYTAPSTEEYKVVSQTGPKWMINLVLKRLMETEQESIEPKIRPSTQVSPLNYNFTMIEAPDVAEGCTYVLGVEPKTPNKFLFRGRIWVDDKDFAVCRIEAEPAKNPSFWIKKTAIHHSFVKVGDFWFPAENKSVSNVRLDGRATLTIKYEDYEIQASHALVITDTNSTAN